MISSGGLSSRRRSWRISQPTARPIAMPPTHAADEREPGVPEREAAGHDRRHGEAVGDERRPVVDQALALDDRDEPPRNAEPARDRARGDRVGRRDDRAEHERRRPAHAVDHRVGDHARPPTVVATTSPTASRPIGRRFTLSSCSEVKNVPAYRSGGRTRDEHEVRRQLELRHPGDEADRDPAEDEQDRVRDRAAPARARAARRPPRGGRAGRAPGPARAPSDYERARTQRRQPRAPPRPAAGSAAVRSSAPSRGFVMNPVSTRTTGTFAQLKPVRSLRSTTPRLRAPVAARAAAGRSRPRACSRRRRRPSSRGGGRARASRPRSSADRTTRRRGCGASARRRARCRTARARVAAPVAVAVAGHRDAVAAREQQRTCPARDRERDRRLARRAAAVLDLQLARAGADRLELPPDRRARCRARDRGR